MDSKRIAVIIFIIFLILPCYAISFQRGIKDITLPVQITSETSPVQSMTVSQNGNYMVIASDRKGFTDLWKLSADPRQVILPERLTSDPSAETDPAFSPDNRFIVYTGTGYDVKGDIFFLDLNNKGAGPFRLTDRSTEDGGACFAPDGDIIYFHQKRPGNIFNRIVSLNLNNKSEKVFVLETNCDGSFPSVSPDGRKICFVSYNKNPSGDIFLFDIKQKIVRELTEGPFVDFSPSWSSDGKTIFFSRVSMDTDRDGSISEKDTASAYKISVEDENLKVYPVTPENEHITNLITADGRLFYISNRLSGIPNSWSLPEEGMIPGQENADKQLEFAEVMERYIPNPYLKILLYYAVPGNFPREPDGKPDVKPDKTACAKYWIGKMYRKEKMADAAVRVFNDVRLDYKDSEPYYSLSGIEKIAIETEIMMEETADSIAKEEIVTKAIEELNAFSGHEYRILSARAGIESSKLLQKAGSAERLLEAIKILDKIEKSQAAGRAEVAEAMILKAGIYDNIGSVDQVYPLYMSIVHNYPDQSGPAEIAVGSILNKAISGMGHESFNRKIDRLIRIAEENQDKAPLLAMGALNRAGDLYFAEDRWSPAKDVYRRVLDEFPASETQTTAARFSLAEILFREERFREALKLYEKEISFRPAEDKIQRLARQGYIRKSVAAGEYLYRLGEVYTAQNRFSELIDYDASIVEAHRGYIKCAASLNLMEKTLKNYRQRLQKDPDDPVAVYCVGLCLTYLDTKESVEEARKLLIRSVSMNGQIEYFHQTLGYVFEVLENVYNQKGNLENALESYKKAYFLNSPELNPDNTANLLLNLGNTYFSLGHFHKAFSIYKDFQETGKPFDHKDREILFYRRFGMAAFQVDENKESIDSFSKALVLIKDVTDPPGASDDFEYSRHLDSMKAEVLDRLGLAFQEDRNWEAAVKTFEKVFESNKKLDLKENLAVNRRSIAYNQYRQSETLFGKEKEQLLGVAEENFIKASELVEKYGVAGKKKKAEEGLISLDLQISIDKTGSTAAGRGFSVEQEKRLAEAFISRINLELGRPAPAEAAIEKQLTVYKQGMKISDSDLFGVSLLFHRAGLIANSGKDYHKAFEHFRRSAELCLRMKNSVSTALNVANMAHALARADDRKTVVPVSGQISDQETGGRDFHDSLRLLSGLDKKVSNLLRVSDFASEGSVEAIYHNTMGVFWMSMGQGNSGKPAEAVKQIEQYRKAICHFITGIEALKSVGNYSKRKKVELEATFHLNMADVSRQLGEGDRAKQYYESTLEVIQKGFLPDLEWRALAGLGRYDEALLKLENVMITRAGCEPYEITGTFGGKIIELSDQGNIEDAFNMMEKLSELERFNRTAFIFRSSCEKDPDFYMDLYPRLVAISDLKIRLKSAKGSEKDYFKERINDEEKLVRLKTGDNLEKLPEVISMISDKDMQE
ncbi:MAG: tetratricopeptide repeat protein, partial [Deltaproteobacteria bacterium]|nr:tetratricopeptide repeat protein [Deltaproteobacteria bacterium]